MNGSRAASRRLGGGRPGRHLRRGSRAALRSAAVVVLVLCGAAPTGAAQQARSGAAPLVEIRIRDAESGAPVPGARVAVHPFGPAGGLGPAAAEGWRAGADGSVRPQLAPERRYRVEVTAAGYAAASLVWGPVQAGDSLVVHLTPAPVPLPELHVAVRPSPADYTRYELDVAEVGGSVAQRLARLPGVSAWGRGPGGPEVVALRGSRPEDVRVTLDGVPLSDPLTGAADLSLIPPASVAKASVTLGAGATAGGGASAGAVHLSSRTPRPGIAVGATAGSFGLLASDVEAGWTGPAGEVGLFAHLERARNDFAFANRVLPGTPRERRVNADRSAWHALATGSLSAWPLRVVARTDGVERGVPGRMGVHVWDEARWSDRRHAIGVSWDPPGGRRVGLSWSGRHSVFRDPRLRREERLRADQLLAEGATPLPGGAEASWEASWARVGGHGMLHPQTRWVGGIRAARAFEPASGVVVRPAVGVEGAREGVAVSPSLGVRWEAAPGWGVFARASRARRLPTFADLFFGPGSGTRPRTDLRPERVRLDAEVGLEWARDALLLRGATFYRSTRDPIIWLPSILAVWAPTNAQALAAAGVEIEAGWRSATGWVADAAATLQRSRVVFANGAWSPQPYQPSRALALGLGREGASRTVRAELEWVGSRRTSVFGPHELPPYAVLSFRGRQTFTLGEKLRGEIRVGITNALDARYERVELFPEPGRALEIGISLRPGRNPSLPGGSGLGSLERLPTTGDDRDDAAGAAAHERPDFQRQERLR